MSFSVRERDLARIVVGNVLITSSYAFITVPLGIVNGGVTSFSMVVSRLLPLEVSTTANIVTVALLIVGWACLGRAFLVKTLFSSGCYMVMFTILSHLGTRLPVPFWLGVPLAAVIVGVGYHFCLVSGASTAGFDVLALVVHRRFSRIGVSTALRAINLLVVCSALPVYGPWSIVAGLVFTMLQTGVIGLMGRRFPTAEGSGEQTATESSAMGQSDRMRETNGSRNHH